MAVKRCSKCGHEPKLDEVMWEFDGGVVLCKSCHSEWLKTKDAKGVGKPVGKPPEVMLITPPERRRLPAERAGFTHKFTILAMEHGEPKPVKGYLTVGLYEDGSVGEIFVKMAKQGSQVSGFVDAWAIAVSMMLQLGVPLETIINRFENMRFEPSGRIEGQSDLALSPIDYVCKYLHRKFYVAD